MELVAALDVETAVFCAVAGVLVLADDFAVVVAVVSVVSAADAEGALDAEDAVALEALVDCGAAVNGATVVLLPVEGCVLAAAAGAAVVVAAEGVVTDVAALPEVELLVEGWVVELAAAWVDEACAESDEPQAVSAEQQATRLICMPIMTLPNLDTIATHFHFCRVDKRNARGFGYTESHAKTGCAVFGNPAVATHRPEASRFRLTTESPSTGQSKTWVASTGTVSLLADNGVLRCRKNRTWRSRCPERTWLF